MGQTKRVKIALAGQPNCGKSTIFNLLTGARQHIANYPGVTVEKKSAIVSLGSYEIEIVDLPGTYSLTSFSSEERVAREFILDEKPDLIINVIDASNPARNFYLTTQLAEMEIPMLVVVNMYDVAKTRGLTYDLAKLERTLGVKAVTSVGSSGKGKRKINEAILGMLDGTEVPPPNAVKLAAAEKDLDLLVAELHKSDVALLGYPLRWMAIKLLENDTQTIETIKLRTEDSESILKTADTLRQTFEKKENTPTEQYIASQRYDAAEGLVNLVVERCPHVKHTFSDKIDAVVLNKYLGIPIMLGIVFLLYELAIVQGYELTNYTWPLLAWIKQQVMTILPADEFASTPILRDFGIWMVNSINALLNYIPIFFILFGLIAILEDSGYMARMAFILDRIFKNYGLHGQSTLPYVMGGVFVGGCAVPAIMATKGIADQRAKVATILTIPFLNCLAKTPFFVLIVSIFFVEHKSLVMFFISTITIIMALIIAKVLTLTVLRHHETAPFIMELPNYHRPTVTGVLKSATSKVWLYLKKVVTIVAAVAVVLFVLIQFPGVSAEKEKEFQARSESALAKFQKAASQSSYYEHVDTLEELTMLLNYAEDYKRERMLITDKEVLKEHNTAYATKNEIFYKILRDRKDKEARKIGKALKKVQSFRKRLFREIKDEKIDNSYLGIVGKKIEYVTQYAGFDWRINVAFLSSFAARESFVATLGALFENDNTLQKAEDRITEMGSYTPLAGLAMIVFMALTPPCIATMIVLKIQLASWKWMLFALFYPIVLALVISIGIFSIGTALEADVLTVMGVFYGTLFAIVVALGFVRHSNFQRRIIPEQEKPAPRVSNL